MSEIGQTFSRYKDALDWSLDGFHEDRRRAEDAMREFYPQVFKRFVRSHHWIRSRDTDRWSRALHNLHTQFGRGDHELRFAAIDGTCGKERLSELIVFYGASYAQGGTLSIEEDAHKLTFTKWSPSEDTSLVAYLPVPLTRLDLFEDEDWLFRSDDEDRSTASVIHTGLMQLAEVYLAYRKVTDQDRPPHIVLLDHSLSSVLLSADVMHLMRQYQVGARTSGWIGARIVPWGRVFEPADGLVAHAHPMNRSLGVPSWRMSALAEAVVARLTDFWQIGDTAERDAGRPLDISELAKDPAFSQIELAEETISRRLSTGQKRFAAFRIEAGRVIPADRLGNGARLSLRQRWYDLRRLFEHVCEQLFRQRRVEALRLEYPPQGPRRGPRWMSGEDLKFLIGLGLRLLIEYSWQKQILLLGVVKDSASRYMSRNLLSVLKAGGIASIPDTLEPAGSDRLICEMVPEVDQSVAAPWSTTEFDALFMTLCASADAGGGVQCHGVQRNILRPSDGLFLRSLIQLFLRRRPSKNRPLMGHVLFLDRIAYPYFDANKRIPQPVSTSDTWLFPMLMADASADNPGQDLAMLVADLLTRNCFPHAMGHPDPLHRADQGAKTLGQRINRLVRASVQRLRADPLSMNFRDFRSEMGG